ncbi:TPA: ornithine carbamoyltransferase [Citrobacter koseri]|nr:ornithine carbamoyltransferase [Citrobacter koseri]
MRNITPFTLKKLVLAMALVGCTMNSTWAILTGQTGTVQGAAPVLSAPSNNGLNAVDLSSNSAGDQLSSGDVLTLTYDYNDTDGDADASSAHVMWYYVINSSETAITAVVNTPATSTTSGTSVMTIPPAAIGADRIKVVIQAYSASGDPISGQTLTIADTGVSGPSNPTTTPPGPVAPGTDVTPAIYHIADIGGTNLIGQTTRLNVGETYVFRLTDAGGNDLTGNVSYNWRLVGTSATDSISAPATGFVTSVTNGNFTVPVNSHADGTPLTGSADGAQGFSLAVDYDVQSQP